MSISEKLEKMYKNQLKNIKNGNYQTMTRKSEE